MFPDEVEPPPIISNFIFPDEVEPPPIISNFIFPDEVDPPPIISNFIFPDEVEPPPMIFTLFVSIVVKEVKTITKEKSPIVKIAFFIIGIFYVMFSIFTLYRPAIAVSLQCKTRQHLLFFLTKKRLNGRTLSSASEWIPNIGRWMFFRFLYNFRLKFEKL
jgi:hypothetical protein